MRTLACALVLVGTAAAAPQGGYTKQQLPEHGIEFPRARDYEAIPLQPDEHWKVLYFAEKESKAERRVRRVRPRFFVVRIDWVPDPPPEEKPLPPPVPTPEPEDEGRTRAEPMEVEAEPEAPPPINSLVRYLEQELEGWELGRPEDGRERDGYQGTEYPLYRQKSKVFGWAYDYTVDRRRSYALIGFCHEDDWKEQTKIWRYMAERMRFSEPESGDAKLEQKLRRQYERVPFRDAEYRIGVRKRLVGDWQAEDTENYIVVYDTRDQPLRRRILREIEAIRKEYLRLFPPAGEMEAVSTLRVCKSRDEYMAYGGMQGTVGYWNSATEELVMFDAAVQKGARSIDTDTFIVLYHEAFHQYIHYSAGALSPHSWFNEGYGDYFSGARIKNGKVQSIGINSWRIRSIQRVSRGGDHVPWDEIIRYEQKDYYARSWLCYAQGWSMVYFLRKADVVQKHPQWSKILDVYFETLKRAFEYETAFLEKQGRLDQGGRAAAGQRAREKAVEAAFEDVDVRALEREWEDFVLALDPDG